MALMGYREYARHRGCSLKAVQKAIDDKRIGLTEDARGKKKIDSDLADAAWMRNTDPAKQSLMYTAGPAASTAPATEEDEADDVPGETGSSEYRAARTAREQIRVKREQMAHDAEAGRLVPVDDASRAVYTAFRALRDSILNVPVRIKHAVAAEADAEKVEQLIEAELEAALRGFDERAALKETDDDEDDEAQP